MLGAALVPGGAAGIDDDIIDLSAYETDRNGVIDLARKRRKPRRRAAIGRNRRRIGGRRPATPAPTAAPTAAGGEIVDLGTLRRNDAAIRPVAAGGANRAMVPGALYFSTLEIAGDSRFAGFGARFFPSPALDGSGVVLAFKIGSGWYRYRLSRKPERWNEAAVGGLGAGLGYRLRRPGLGVTTLAGPALEYQHLARPDPGNRGAGLRVALRGAVDLWAKPVDRVLLTGFAALSTFEGRWYGRVFAGHDIGDDLFLGLEATTIGDRDHAEWRLGAAALGIPAGPLTGLLSTGLRLRPDKAPGLFVSTAVWRRF